MTMSIEGNRIVSRGLIASATLVCAAGLLPGSAEAAAIGQLDCSVSGGVGFVITSSRALNCRFLPVAGGRMQHYVGTIKRFGLDIGFQGPGRLVWGVIGAGLPGPGALAGTYAGGSASVTAGVGVGANALVGGNANSFTLQPVSLEGQAGGLAVAAGVGEMTLEPAP